MVDYETGKPMPFCVPTHENGRPTKAPGYYTDREAALGRPFGFASDMTDDVASRADAEAGVA